MQNVDALAAALSLPFDGPAPRRAADELLSASDSGRVLDRLFPQLMWHKCWRHALAHISRSGGDLSALSVSTRRLRESLPVKKRRLWTVDDESRRERTTLQHFDRLLTRHQELLRTAVEDLRDQGTDILLLAGRALEARYPDYGDRMEFDSDLATRDVEGGMDLVERLASHGYALRFLIVHGSATVAEASLERRVDGHSVNLEIEMGDRELHGGPLWERSGVVDWRGHSMRAPSSEDLLLALASRARKHRCIQQVAINDAAVILQRDAGELDWDYLADEMRSRGLQVHLGLIVEAAQRILPGNPIPDEPRKALQPAGLSRALLRWGRPLELSSPTDPSVLSTGGWRSRLLTRLALRSASRVSVRASSSPARLAGWLAYRLWLRVARAAPRRLYPSLRAAARLRPAAGSLCELRERALDAEAPFCLSNGLGRSPTGRLATVGRIAARIPGPGTPPHDCYRYQYRLDHRSGSR